MSYNRRGYGMTTYQAIGDPFLGSIIKGVGKVVGGVAKVAGGVIGGPAGGILSTVGGVLGGGGGGVSAVPSIRPISITGSLPGLPGMPQVGVSLPQRYAGPTVPGLGIPYTTTPGAMKPSGYHLNKSGYFLKTGQYVPPGSRWVRNRSMNPANGRALRRAIRRAKSFDTTVKRNRKNLRSLARI